MDIQHLTGHCPEFEIDDLDWALGELLHLISESKRTSLRPEEYQPLLFYRCMHVLGCQPLDVRLDCLVIIRNAIDPYLEAVLR